MIHIKKKDLTQRRLRAAELNATFDQHNSKRQRLKKFSTFFFSFCLLIILQKKINGAF